MHGSQPFNDTRVAHHPVHTLFLDRWSPRAFSGEEMPEETLAVILEAARWAPSAFNAQPWRFIYARRGDEHWERFVSLLMPFNQSWAKHAAVLIFVFSKKGFRRIGHNEDTFLRSHSFDAGAAWAHIALQATLLRWSAHAMSGFDHEAALTVLQAPDGYTAEAAVALGRRGDAANLDHALALREQPSGRHPLNEIAAKGSFAAFERL